MSFVLFICGLELGFKCVCLYIWLHIYDLNRLLLLESFLCCVFGVTVGCESVLKSFRLFVG